jgi:hypothetical protein
MSKPVRDTSAYAIAALTVVLKDLLDNSLVERGAASALGDVTVSALAPDRVQTGAEERAQLNLFLYRITPNTRWRGVPAERANPGRPALALDLHYLLTAYGQQDFQAELLLGQAIQTLQDTPVITRDAIRASLAAIERDGSRGPQLRSALAQWDPGPAIERVELCAEFLSSEEMSRLWSALQARYRPSITYKASMVAIEPGPGG